MKRFHVHVAVPELGEAIRFYSALFGATPARVEGDYAKWMLDDPRVNFAISTREAHTGVDHLGLQVDTGEELAGMEAQLRAADTQLQAEPEAACCYARSDKYWARDPAGIRWETFHTHGSLTTYGGGQPVASQAAASPAACCTPAPPGSSACCTPLPSETGACCS